VSAFFSHDEFIDFFSESAVNLAPIREELGKKFASRYRVSPSEDEVH
jgi:hypothetical protein